MTDPKTKRKRRTAGRPPGSSGDITRARIIEGARGCFGARGFGATTNRELADSAGLTAAAIYRYFDSKLDLYMATVQGALAELEPVLSASIVGCEGGRDELEALAEAAGALHEERPYLASFLSSLPVEMQRHPEIAEAMTAEPDPVSMLVAGAVERAQDRGQLADDVNPEHVAAMVVACNIGLSLWASAIIQEPSSDAMRTYARLLAGRLFK